MPFCDYTYIKIKDGVVSPTPKHPARIQIAKM
jgi:hypothetical protein